MTAIVPPTPIDDLPAAPLPTDTEAEFDTKAFALVAAQEDFVDQANALAENVENNATAADERATLADGFATTATTQAGIATTQAGIAVTQAGLASGSAATASTHAGTATTAAVTATTQAGIATTQAGLAATARNDAQTAQGLAEDARDAAEGFRDQAEVFATGQLIGSSATTLTPGVGSKAFTIETGRAFVPGMYLVVTSVGAPTNKMAGYVTSYNSATGALVLNVDAFGGASSRSDWAIGVAVAGSVGGITTQRVTTNTSCVANVRYLVALAGITLTLPASYTAGDKQDFVEEIGVGARWSLDFNGHKLRSQTKGLVSVPANFSRLELTYFDATGGLE